MKRLKENIKELVSSGGTTREITDALLELDRDCRDLGKDYTAETLKEAKERSKLIYKAISEIDKELGKMLIVNIDE